VSAMLASQQTDEIVRIYGRAIPMRLPGPSH
jgi:hypothetical protein